MLTVHLILFYQAMRDEELAFSQALHIAQQKGYAEADPTNDIEGFDAYYKALILSRVVFGTVPAENNTIRRGIQQLVERKFKSQHLLG